LLFARASWAVCGVHRQQLATGAQSEEQFGAGEAERLRTILMQVTNIPAAR
jgi:hypothetical protein